MERRKPLRRDGEKAREFAARRSEIERRTPLSPGERRRRARLGARLRGEVYRRSNKRCVGCRQRPRRLTVHHVLPVRLWPEHELEADNMVAACERCHANHEAAFERLAWLALPGQVRAFVAREAAEDPRVAPYAARTYPGYGAEQEE
jgi:hypothetical protein